YATQSALLVGRRVHCQERVLEVRYPSPIERRMGVEDLQTAHQQHRQAEEINPMRQAHDRRVTNYPASPLTDLPFRLESAHFFQSLAVHAVILLHHVLLMHHVLLSARAHAGTLTGLRVLFLADAPASGGWRANSEIRKGLLVKFSGRRKIVFLLEAFH